MNSIVINIALPLLCAFLLPVIDRSSRIAARVTGPLVLMVMMWSALIVFKSLEHPVSIALGGFLPPLGISFHLDQLALLMTIVIPLIMLLLWPYQSDQNLREQTLLLLLAGASSGLALSGDLFNIYVFYELISVASFGLAAANRKASAFAATFRYLLISGLGTVLALTGIALIYTQTGTLNLSHIGLLASRLDNPLGLSAFALILLGIGVKAEIFPLNGWVAEVYSTASTRTSALLAGLVSKLAVLAIVRLLVVAYDDSDASLLLLVFGVLGIIWGEFSAWRARDLKRLFSFSSIGQLGMILLAFSIPGEAGMFAGIALMLHHLVAKPALFLLTEKWHRSINSLRGAAKLSPLAAALFVLFSLSLIGVPPLPGFWAKMLLMSGLVGMDAPIYYTALAVLMIATVIEAQYLMRVAVTLYSANERSSDLRLASNTGIMSLFALVLLSALVTLSPLGAKLYHIAAESSNRALYIRSTFNIKPAPVLKHKNAALEAAL